MYRICIPCQPFLRIYSLEKLRLKVFIPLCFGTIGCLSEGDTTKQLAESAAEQNVTITNTMVPNADALAMADLNTVTITIVNMAGIKQTSVQIKKNASDILFKDFLKLCQENSQDIDFSQLNPKYYQNLNKWVWISNLDCLADIAFSFVKADGSLLLPETLIQTATSEDDDITITVLQEKLPRNSKPKTRKELDQEMMRREK